MSLTLCGCCEQEYALVSVQEETGEYFFCIECLQDQLEEKGIMKVRVINTSETVTSEQTKTFLDQEGIKKIIPHREPFLLVDTILELEVGKRAVGVKHVKPEEEVFKGHFPDHPVMPGVLIVEALAQVGAVALLSMPEFQGKIAYFARIESAKFIKQVTPPSTLLMEVELLSVSVRHGYGKGKAVAKVDGEIVCEAEITFAIEKD